jgi:hypothetical protein
MDIIYWLILIGLVVFAIFASGGNEHNGGFGDKP